MKTSKNALDKTRKFEGRKMARSSLEYSPTLVEDSGENQTDEQMTERHFMPVLARLPSVILAALSYIVVMVTCLVLVYGASVQPLARFMSALSDTQTKLASHTACGLWTNSFLMIGFVLLHSGLANCGFFKRFAGPLHRCLYNIISCAYILVTYLYWTTTPTFLLWNLSSRFWLQLLFILLHIQAWSSLILSLLSFDHLELLGLPQILLGSTPLKQKSAQLQKLYSGLRHPSLVLPSLILWAVPAMTIDRLLLAIFLPLYMIWGTSLDREDSHYAREKLCSKVKSICGPGSREREE